MAGWPTALSAAAKPPIGPARFARAGSTVRWRTRATMALSASTAPASGVREASIAPEACTEHSATARCDSSARTWTAMSGKQWQHAPAVRLIRELIAARVDGRSWFRKLAGLLLESYARRI